MLPNLMFFFLFFSISSAMDTLTPSHPLSYGETLISANGTFALGFFTPQNTTNLYLGIWYHNLPVQTVVWVANRQNPIPNLNATLSITPDDASLHLNNLWSSSSPSFPNSIPNPIAQLLDTGNLVIKSSNSTSYLWQSFDYPTDTLLSGMKLGPNLKTGIDRNLTSWLTPSDPSPGKYTLAIDLITVPQLVIRDSSGSWLWRGGPWNGYYSRIGPNQFFYVSVVNGDLNIGFNSTPEEIYLYFSTIGDSTICTITMDQNGTARLYEWKASLQKWNLEGLKPSDDCDFFSACGTNAICDSSRSPICQCLDGFSPRNPVSWSRGNWSDGCAREEALGCGANGTDEFMLVGAAKLPDTTEAAANISLGLEECKKWCLMNCSCKAYASIYFSGIGLGCTIWMADIKDLLQGSASGNAGDALQDLYVRVASPGHEPNGSNKPLHKKKTGSNKRKTWVFVVTSVTFVLFLLIILTCVLTKRRQKHKNEERSISFVSWGHEIMHKLEAGKKGNSEISLFQFSEVVSATNNFSYINKLGEGGFGPVYKGKLPEGQDVAIKRLSAKSGQGLEEFKNEIFLIAKLQHRNLIKLLGCCIYGEEKMLIYEFMPNKSLDLFIFGNEQRLKLDWTSRFRIIEGIAQGLLYLHKHSRLRVIHRDLKAWDLWKDGTWMKLVDPALDNKFQHDEVIRCIYVALLCVQERPEDRPVMFDVATMLNNESLYFNSIKEPTFFTMKDASDSKLPLNLHVNASSNDLSVSTIVGR